jgi:hypothetical protein
LRAALPPELEPSNPQDCAADLTDEFAKVFERGLKVLADAPEVSMLGLEADFRDDYLYEPGLFQLAKALPGLTSKPCFVYSSFGLAHNRRLADELAELGIPYLNGAATMMTAVRKVQAWATAPVPQQHTVTPCTGELPAKMDEFASLDLLRSFGMTTAQSVICETPRRGDRSGLGLGLSAGPEDRRRDRPQKRQRRGDPGPMRHG